MLTSAPAAREIPLAPGSGPRDDRRAFWVVEPDAAASIAEDGLDRAVFEGILDNRDDLAAATDAPPAASDAGLVLRAYRRWGEGAIGRIKGRFALCVWDGGEAKLFCARDPLGYHPLFYADTRRGLFLSSSAEALARHDAGRAAVNRLALAEHLAHQWVDNAQTYYAGIRRVPPGHAMVVTRAGRRIFRHWDPIPPGERVRWVRSDEMPRFDELLDQAVERCLRLGPAGIYLSGGLDSAAVAAIATDASARLGLPTPLALSLSFPHPECGEEETQRRLAAALGLAQVMLDLEDTVRPSGFLLSLVELSRQYSFPTWFVWRPAYQCLAREAAGRGCRVILSGGGGDDWLTVDAILAADLLRAANLPGLVRLTANLCRSYTAGLPRLMWYVLWTNGLRPWLRLGAVRALRTAAPGVLRSRRVRRVAASIPLWVAPERELRQELEERGAAIVADPEPGPDGFYASGGRALLDHPLAAMESEESFESSRRSGIPEMEPFCDPDLVDFLYRMPPDALNVGGRSKGPVRQLLARRFPHLGYDRQKKSQAGDYLVEIVFREGRQAWDTLGGTPALAELGVLDERAFAGEVDRILGSRDVQEAHRIMDALVLEAWARARL